MLTYFKYVYLLAHLENLDDLKVSFSHCFQGEFFIGREGTFEAYFTKLALTENRSILRVVVSNVFHMHC